MSFAERKVIGGQWKSVDAHRSHAFGRIEEQCTDPEGNFDWEKAQELKNDWDKRHGYNNKPKWLFLFLD